MRKKFFSLINGGTVRLAPNTKIVASEGISTILEAKDVLKRVKEDAKLYQIDVSKECEKLKEQAQKEGFEAGYSEWIKRIAELEEEIQITRRKSEKVIVPIALKAAKKIVGRELELSENAVVDIISNSLKTVSSHKKIKIYVNKNDYSTLEKYKEQLKKLFEHLEVLTILTQDDIERGGCIIETEGGIINAQLENQWMILENAFQKLMEQRKDALLSEDGDSKAKPKTNKKNPQQSQ